MSGRLNTSQALKFFLLFIIAIFIISKITREENRSSKSENLQWNYITYRGLSRDEILEETSKFEKRGVDEDDPDLIEFVKGLIKPPSFQQYNFDVPNQPNQDYSQHHQSVFIDEILEKKTDGFYIGNHSLSLHFFNRTL